MQLVYFGNGFTHSDIYNMPVYLRKFYYRELVELKEEENKQIKKQTSKNHSFKT